MITDTVLDRDVGAVYTPPCVIVPQFPPHPVPPTLHVTAVFAGPTTVAVYSCEAPAFNWRGPVMLTVVPPDPCDTLGLTVIVSEPVLVQFVEETAVIVTRMGLEIFDGAV